MKLFFVSLLLLLFLNWQSRPYPLSLVQYESITRAEGDSTAPIHVVNYSSLKRLPHVLKDLLVALNGSVFVRQQLLEKEGFDIILQDVVCKRFDTAASITYRLSDPVYHLKINRFNKQASDRALAATLIHEIMHCMLLNIDRRARTGEGRALSAIESFNRKLNSSRHLNNGFFSLMNSGEKGQHELMYQLFYPDMVQLLSRFTKIHRQEFRNQQDAEYLMWSGLQQTTAYQELPLEQQTEIEWTILKEKGIMVFPAGL